MLRIAYSPRRGPISAVARGLTFLRPVFLPLFAAVAALVVFPGGRPVHAAPSELGGNRPGDPGQTGLSPTELPSQAGVLSDAETFPEGVPVSGPILRTALAAHGYREVQGPPRQSGQFQLLDRELQIVTRDYYDSRGAYIPKLRLTYASGTGQIRNHFGPPIRALMLEPIRIGELKENPSGEHRPFVEHLRTSLDSPAPESQTVYSTLEPPLQRCAESALGVLDRPSALMAADVRTRAIRAWAEHGAAAASLVTAIHPRGTIAKPFVYLTAFEGIPSSPESPGATNLAAQSGVAPINPLERINETSPTVIESGRKLLGPESAALAERIGTDRVQGTLAAFGLKETSVISVTTALVAVARGGLFAPLRTWTSRADAAGEIHPGPGLAHSGSNRPETPVSSPQAAFLLLDMLRQTEISGPLREIRRQQYRGDLAALTGSAANGESNWALAVTPATAVAVWIGPGPAGTPGEAIAAGALAAYLECADLFLPHLSFQPPPGVRRVLIDTLSGKLATDRCPADSVESLALRDGDVPRALCPFHTGRKRQTDSVPQQAPAMKPAISPEQSPPQDGSDLSAPEVGNSPQPTQTLRRPKRSGGFWRNVQRNLESVLR